MVHFSPKSSLFVALAMSNAMMVTAQEPQHPNIIYILADDLGYGDLSCTGQKIFTTPNIDRLRAEGMLFTQHYSGCSISAPSRCCLMTGKHTGHCPIRGNRQASDASEGQLALPDSCYTLAEMFKDGGYATGAFGKWGLGAIGSEGDPINQGFDEFFGYNCQVVAHKYYPPHLWHNSEKIILAENAGNKKGIYACDLIQQYTLDFIERHKNEPFFLFVPTILPHAELLVPEDEIINKYRNRFEEQPYIAKEGGDYGPGMLLKAYCSQAEPYATYAAMVSRLDKYVGEIMDKLKDCGIDRNTIIFFTSDNGPHREGGANPDYFHSYGPWRGIKRDFYEGGIRLPLIVRAPGIVEENSNSDHICAIWDMLPTMAEIAGVDMTDKDLDGISLMAALTGKQENMTHEYLYWELHEAGGKIAIRQDDWKFIVLNVKNPKKREVLLYNITDDPQESTDLASEYPEIVEQMKKLVIQAHDNNNIFQF